MEPAIASAIFTPLILAVILGFALRGRPKVDVGSETFSMRYGKVFRAVVGLIVLAALACAVAPLLLPKASWGPSLTLAGMFALVATPLAIELRSTTTVTAESVTTRSIWRGERTVTWADLEHVTFGLFTGAFTLRGRHGTEVRVGGMLDGVQEFARILESREPDCGNRKAVARWRQALAGLGVRMQ